MAKKTKVTKRDLLLDENLESVLYTYFRFKKNIYLSRFHGPGILTDSYFANLIEKLCIILVYITLIKLLLVNDISQFELLINSLLAFIFIDGAICFITLLIIGDIICTVQLFIARKQVLTRKKDVTYSFNCSREKRQDKPIRKLFRYTTYLNLCTFNEKFVYCAPYVLLDEKERSKYTLFCVLKTVVCLAVFFYIVPL